MILTLPCPTRSRFRPVAHLARRSDDQDQGDQARQDHQGEGIKKESVIFPKNQNGHFFRKGRMAVFSFTERFSDIFEKRGLRFP